MKARHVTSENKYRSPFGAAQLGGSVLLSVDVWGEDVVFCTLRVWTDAHGLELIDMHGTQEGDHLNFAAEYTPRETGVVWYSFDIEASDGSVWRYGAREGWTTGEGAFAYGEPPSFQITVYEPREVQPDWYKNGVVYQIFPDRFARGEGWHELAKAALAEPRGGTERALVEDWTVPPTYVRNDDNSIARWDFYGGTLDGIRERLDYLAGLGITCIYLNPIFEALSNHRYDTADYLRIDPMLGDEKSLERLCSDAEERGISVILDGVFNHVGADSIYFNRYGSYPGEGAYQGEDSPYRKWFSFNEDGTYSGWWGNPDLPDTNDEDPSFRELICGKDCVVRRWMRAGVRGWRLDVADELSDEFIVLIKEAVLAERPDALLIGEVWEDASHKLAYGKLRQYFEGKELDGVMNYPLRDGILAFMLGRIGASELAARLEELYENYPREAFYSGLNLLGSHDRERLFTVLGGAPDPDTLSEEERASYRLPENMVGLAQGRLWACALMQMTLPGVPCIYYGDERGMEGFRDPYNRAPMQWGAGHPDCFTIYRNAVALRRAMPVLVDGDFEPFASGEDVFGFWRHGKDESVCVLVNGSLEHAHTIGVPMVAEEVSDVVSGRGPKVAGGQAEVFLWPLGTAVLHFHHKQRLQKPLERGMGVLCHVTSVPNGGKPGTLGAPARAFVDWLAEGGQAYWQVLPVNPTDCFGSPYAGPAAFAGNPALLEKGQAGTLAALAGVDKTTEFKSFCAQNAYWLEPYCVFCAIKELQGEDVPWQEWPAELRTFSSDLARDPKISAVARRHAILQFAFENEWRELREYANERGISIVGDMPMFVSADSADAWSEPDVFYLDADGHALRQAGAPGDSFTPEGQLWGNPTYRWDVMAERGYDWWMRRFSRLIKLYDYVRLDHFIGFASYYSVEEGHLPSEGEFAFGPGLALFEAAFRQFGPLPFVAEDLGSITPAVRALLSETGFCGMDVAEFADYDVREGYQAKPNTVAYCGTHDNQTLLGWVQERFGLLGDEARELAERIRASLLASSVDVAILQLQDVLGLDDTARMNTPGTAGGNWRWQASDDDVAAATQTLRRLADESGRARA